VKVLLSALAFAVRVKVASPDWVGLALATFDTM